MIIKPLITRFEKQDMHFVAKHGFFRAARLVRAHKKLKKSYANCFREQVFYAWMQIRPEAGTSRF